jgi:predicted permease
MAFGYAATFTRVFNRDAANALASFVFYFAIPVMMFRNMATTALPEAIAWGYLLSYLIGVALVFGIGMTAARLGFGGSFERQAIIGFGSAFGNSVLLGIPLVLTALGEQASLPLFLLLAFHSGALGNVRFSAAFGRSGGLLYENGGIDRGRKMLGPQGLEVGRPVVVGEKAKIELGPRIPRRGHKGRL